MPHGADDRLVRMPEVCRMTGLHKNTIYNRIAAGAFPRQVRLTERLVGWWESDVRHWMETRPVTGTLPGIRQAAE